MAQPSEGTAAEIYNGDPTKMDSTIDTAVRDSGGSSDGEGERTAREKLKKTSIAGLSQLSKSAAGNTRESPLQQSTFAETARPISSDTEPAIGRGRPARKRSFDDLQNDDSLTSTEFVGAAPPNNSHHKRMRSRDISSREHVSYKPENEAASPVEEESDADAQKSPGGPGVLIDAPSKRDGTPPTDEHISQSDPQQVLSPKKKRSRDQFDKEHGPTLDLSEAQELSSSQMKESDLELAPTVSRSVIGEPEKKRHRDEETATSSEQTGSAIPKSGGFANTSSVSPFGNFTSPKSPSKDVSYPKAEVSSASESKPTETQAFASSGLSAFASSEKSPFSALGATSSASGFGGSTSSGGFGAANNTGGFGSASAGFGNTGATSPFGAKASSGFGSLGGLGPTGGFGGGARLGGAAKPFSGSLPPFGGPPGSTSSFGAASSTFGGASGSKQKAFGAPEDEDEDESDDAPDTDDGEGAHVEDSHRATEQRLRAQDTRSTGEEDEHTIFSCRAKLYFFEDQWKERGVGTLKINVKLPDYSSYDRSKESASTVQKARLIMRTDGVHRVVLNTPIFREMKAGIPESTELHAKFGAPNGKTMILHGMEKGKPGLFQLKLGKEETVKLLYEEIVHQRSKLELANAS